MSDKVYCYRGVDQRGTSVFGKFLASSQEDAEQKVALFGIKSEAVYEDGQPPPPETIKAIQSLAVQQPPAAPQPVKPPPPSQVRGITPEQQAEIDRMRQEENARQVAAALLKSGETKEPGLPSKDQRQEIAKTVEVLTKTSPAFQPATGKREELLCGPYSNIKDRLEHLLDEQNGTVRALQIINTSAGAPYLAVVVQYERKQA